MKKNKEFEGEGGCNTTKSPEHINDGRQTLKNMAKGASPSPYRLPCHPSLQLEKTIGSKIKASKGQFKALPCN